MMVFNTLSLLIYVRKIRTCLAAGLVLSTFCASIVAPFGATVLALSQSQTQVFGEGIYYFNIDCVYDNGITGQASAPTPTLAAFVDKYGQMAYQNSINTGVPYEFTLGQAIVESGYGGSALSAQYNNFFGIKAGSGWTGATVTFPTEEFVNGSYVTINAAFRAYPTASAGFADHDAFLRDNSRYAGAFQYSNDPLQFLNAVAAAGYATSPTYAQTVGAVIKQVQAYVASKSLFPPSSQITYNITPSGAQNSASSTSVAVGGTCSCNTSNAGGVMATLNSTVVPEPYTDIFNQAGQKYNVAPALLAAIFYGGEHGNSWPTPPPPYGNGQPWASSSAGAQGPFQFLSSTWAKYGVDGSGDGKADVQDLTDAAFGAANYLANSLGAANTADEQIIRKAAAGYNGNNDPSSTYANNVWSAFQLFNSGTGSTASSNSICPSSNSGNISAYQNPYRDVKNLTPMRIDEGVDYGGGGPIYALGNGTVVLALNGKAGWPGGNFVTYQLSDGPAAGKFVYFAENCPLAVTKGEQVTSKTVICNLVSGYPFSESGWAADPAQANDSAAAYQVYRPDGTATAYGENFNQLLVKLGVPSGTYQFANQQGGINLTGSLPAGWPTW